MSFKEVIKFFSKYFKSERKLFIKASILILLSTLIGLLYGYLMGLAIDKASLGSFSIAIIILVVNLLINVIDSIFLNRLGRILVEKISNNMMEKISYEVYYKVGLLPARAFEEKTSGELINRIVNDSNTITETFIQLLRTIISLLSSFIVFIYICFNSLIVAFEVIFYLICFLYFSKMFLPDIKEKQKEITQEKDKVVAGVNETIRGIREIRALGIRDKLNVETKNNIRNIFYKTNKQMINERNYYAVIMGLNSIFESVVFITCILLICFKLSTFAFFMSITYYLYRFMGTIDSVMSISASYQKMRVSIERIDEILSNKLYQDEKFGNLNKTNIRGIVEFKNVTFKYSNEEKTIFKNLNLKIEPNKKIAIVGKSGQGKTSLFNLLLRYFEPDQGVILIDDIPINNYDEKSFRKNIAIIRQEPFLFNKSIIENFKVLDKKITLKKIKDACKIAEIDNYIMSLPHKYETIIGEGGVNLSGGQKQRIAIARALLKESKIILFDEATSALDNESQGKIKKTINNLVKEHTIIVVAHRLSTIIDADIIYVVDKGKIVGSGTHKELLDNNKIYQKLYNSEK